MDAQGTKVAKAFDDVLRQVDWLVDRLAASGYDIRDEYEGFDDVRLDLRQGLDDLLAACGWRVGVSVGS